MSDGLAAALVRFQAQVPTIPKNNTAKIPMKGGGSYSYKYADLSDVWEAIRKPLSDNGLAVTQPLITVSQGCLGIKTKIWHVSGETDESVFEFPVAGKSPQEVGSAITYYKRYALSAALGLDIDDDDDGAAATHRPQAKPAAKPLSPADQAREDLLKLVTANKLDPKKLGVRFFNDYGLDIKDADVETVRGFLSIVADEVAVDKAAG